MYAAARPPTEEKAERPPQDGTARLEHLCRLIAAANPERPNLRGIALLIPYEWTRSNDSLLKVSAIRDDLQTIRQVFKLRCPTVTVFCVRESLPGFSEFTAPARQGASTDAVRVLGPRIAQPRRVPRTAWTG